MNSALNTLLTDATNLRYIASLATAERDFALCQAVRAGSGVRDLARDSGGKLTAQRVSQIVGQWVEATPTISVQGREVTIESRGEAKGFSAVCIIDGQVVPDLTLTVEDGGWSFGDGVTRPDREAARAAFEILEMAEDDDEGHLAAARLIDLAPTREDQRAAIERVGDKFTGRWLTAATGLLYPAMPGYLAALRSWKVG